MPRLVKEGQSPEYFMISCIDSRSNPGTIFNAAPGTFFAHKAMGAIVRPYKKGTALAAALQFAIEYNNIKNIIILGHTGCGAIHALVNDIDDKEITSFLDVAQSGLERAKKKCGNEYTPDRLQRCAEEEIILQSAKNLTTYPSVAKALKENRIEITPWLFSMEYGSLLEYKNIMNKFTPITDH